MPKVPTLSITAVISTAVAGVASTRGVGQPAVERPQRGLDREREHEAQEQRLEHRGVHTGEAARCDAGHDFAEVEGARAVLRGHHIQADHRGQHDQAAEQVVQQELHRGARPPRALAEAADQEVHRDQHGLEEHVEQQHVQRDHRDQHHRLDGQRQGDVGVHAAAVAFAAVVPAGHQQQRNQHRGQQHQDQRDAVHAQGVAGAESRYPRVVFDELVGARRRSRSRP